MLRKRNDIKKNHHIIYSNQSILILINLILPLITRKELNLQKNKDKFGVDQYKLYSNSLFRKQIEDPEKYKDTRIANNEEKAKKFASRITLKNCNFLSEYVTLYELSKHNVLFDKPLSIGFMILEIAKYEMNIIHDKF